MSRASYAEAIYFCILFSSSPSFGHSSTLQQQGSWQIVIAVICFLHCLCNSVLDAGLLLKDIL